MMWRLLVAAVSGLLLVLNAAPSHAAKRAIIIGFSEYSWTKLPGVKADVKRIHDLLKADYEVTVIDDSANTRKAFREIWEKFVESIKDQDEVAVYYAGHAIDVDGLNYLLPLDAEEPTGTKKLSLISDSFILLRKLVEEIQEQTPFFSIFFIDACRTNPYSGRVRGPAKEAGLAHERINDRYVGYTVLFFSADFNESAQDSIPGEEKDAGSPFARAISILYERGKTQPVMNFLQNVSLKVKTIVTPQTQLPQVQGMPPPQFCLGECNAQLMQILYASLQDDGRRRVVDSRTPDPPGPGVSESPVFSFDVPSLKSIGNVIFLGKISQTKCTGNEFSPDNPFGCEFLKKAASVARADGKTTAKDIAQAVSLTDVNMRRSVPRVSGTQAFYDCSVKVVKRGEKVRLKGVAAYQYAGDSFLWGVVDAPSLSTCKS